MKYYKLIQDDTILGVVTSNNFISFSPTANCFLKSDEEHGEYISYKGQLYRSTWMQPITKPMNFISLHITTITEEEYNIYMQAIQNNEIIIETPDEDVEEEIEEEYINESDIISLEFIRASKLSEMSRTCRQLIEAGFDIELRNELRHFSLDTQDQLNLISLSAMAQTQELIPYHADGEMCIFYTAEEMNQIIETATRFKIYHTTYYNALKGYINALDNIADIAAITYGMAIPEEYQSDVLKALDV